MAESTDAPLAGWVAFGPRWATMTEVRGHDTERTARLLLPDRYDDDFAAHPVHPAIVDVAAGLLHDLEPDHSYAPFMYRRVTILAPLTGDVRVHARFSAQSRTARRAIDFDIFDTATGRLLLRAESFAMRKVADQAFGTAGRDVAAVGMTSDDPNADAADPPAEPSVDLLSPEDGATAFLQLLHGGGPTVALIDLPAAPLRVPGLPWADGPAAEPVNPASEVPATPVPAVEPQEPPRDDGEGVPDLLADLRELWTAALGVRTLGLDDDFFDIGGNSLAAVQLTARMNAHFGTDLGAGILFDYPTLRSLAAEVRASRDASSTRAR